MSGLPRIRCLFLFGVDFACFCLLPKAKNDNGLSALAAATNIVDLAGVPGGGLCACCSCSSLWLDDLQHLQVDLCTVCPMYIAGVDNPPLQEKPPKTRPGKTRERSPWQSTSALQRMQVLRSPLGPARPMANLGSTRPLGPQESPSHSSFSPAPRRKAPSGDRSVRGRELSHRTQRGVFGSVSGGSVA